MIHLTTGREFLTTKKNVKVKLTNIHKGVEEGSKSFFFKDKSDVFFANKLCGDGLEIQY